MRFPVDSLRLRCLLQSRTDRNESVSGRAKGGRDAVISTASRVISLFRSPPQVVACLLVVVLGSLFVPAPFGATNRSGAAVQAADRVELTELRTRTSKTYRNADGTFTNSLYTGSVHYRDERGRWQDIQSDLTAAGEPGYGWRNRANSFRTLFKPNVEGQFLRLDVGGRSFAFALDGARPAAGRASGSRAAYDGVFPGVGLEYDLLPDGVKETLVLADANVPTRYRFFVTPLGGERMSATRRRDGSWEFFLDAPGNPIFTLAPPYLVEAGDERYRPVSTTVTKTGERFVIDLVVDPGWLADPARRFPILLDPTIVIQPSVDDAMFEANCPTCTAKLADRLKIGTDNVDVWRSGVRFDLGAIPPAADVEGAELNLFYGGACIWWSGAPSCASGSHTLTTHKMTRPWTATSTTEQTGFDPTALSSYTLPAGAPDDWMTWSVTSAVEDWFYGYEPNFGFLLKRQTEPLSASGPRPPSRRYVDEATLKPRLDVTYTDDVELLPIETAHADGADLEWTRWPRADTEFEKYEVHRSATAGFTPSRETLIKTITSPATTSYRDTTAAANKAFSYRVVANSSASHERRVTLPANGHARRTLQPAPLDGKATFLKYVSGNLSCANGGASEAVKVGAWSTGKYRSLLAFDLAGIPAGANVSDATMSLWIRTGMSFATSVNVHRVTRAWKEGTGATEVCSGDGATWYDSEPNVKWTNPGGDFEATAATSRATTTRVDGWDDYNVTSLVQTWVNGTANLGLLLKLADETLADGHFFTYYADDFTEAPTLRPKLSVTYEDGSRAKAPTVSITSPSAGAQVRGTVTIVASASDDGRVDKVEFLVDGVKVGEDVSAPFEYPWDSTSVANGSHNLTARATDNAGNVTTSAAVSVTTDNSGAPTTTITGPVPPAYEGEVTGDVPRAYWRLGEAAAETVARDATANAFNGTYEGAATRPVGGALANDANTAVSFDGLDDAVIFGDVLDFQGTAPLSLEAWISQPAGSDGGPIVAKLDPSPSGPSVAECGYVLASGGTTITFTRRGGDSCTGASPSQTARGRLPSFGRWHHVVGTYDGTAVRLYVNGVLAGSDSASNASLPNTTSALRVGADNDASFNGAIDEVAVYDTALAAADVRSHYESGANPVAGTVNVTATAADDRGVNKVGFYFGDVQFGESLLAPHSASWNTLHPAKPAYDGRHVLTTRAHDADGNSTTSAPVTATVVNTNGTKYNATFSLSPVPNSMVDDGDETTPAGEEYAVDVTVTNTSAYLWPKDEVALAYRWVDVGSPTVVKEGPEQSLLQAGSTASGTSAGEARTVTLRVDPPTLPSGVDRKAYRLRFDLVDRSTTPTKTWFAEQGNALAERVVEVLRLNPVDIGLERYYQYDGAGVGAGMQHLVNVASGNSILRWTPFVSPGRGLSTVVDLTYNSRDTTLGSPLGEGWSLSISGLTRFGSPLLLTGDDIELTDGDGTTHRFKGSPQGAPVYWKEPPGVHLYLRKYPNATDTDRTWAVTRPDGVTFFYDATGHPTSVEDRNGNRIVFRLDAEKRIERVTDAAGRFFGVAYYATDDVAPVGPEPALALNKVKQVTDHTGSVLDFKYGDDGRLARIVQRGGTKADGTVLADRSFAFAYNSDFAATRLVSVTDPRGSKTAFTYTADAARRLETRTSRDNRTTSFAYDTDARVTSVKNPLGHETKYAYEVAGMVWKITNAKGEATKIRWSGDRHVTRVIEPTGAYREWAYNDNGYPTDMWDELRNHTKLEYENLRADENDTSGKWGEGRTIPEPARQEDGAARDGDDEDRGGLPVVVRLRLERKPDARHRPARLRDHAHVEQRRDACDDDRRERPQDDVRTLRRERPCDGRRRRESRDDEARLRRRRAPPLAPGRKPR